MKKYRFFYCPNVAGVTPDEEIVEFDDDTTEAEVDEYFTQWVFERIDTACEPID